MTRRRSGAGVRVRQQELARGCRSLFRGFDDVRRDLRAVGGVGHDDEIHRRPLVRALLRREDRRGASGPLLIQSGTCTVGVIKVSTPADPFPASLDWTPQGRLGLAEGVLALLFFARRSATSSQLPRKKCPSLPAASPSAGLLPEPSPSDCTRIVPSPRAAAVNTVPRTTTLRRPRRPRRERPGPVAAWERPEGRSAREAGFGSPTCMKPRRTVFHVKHPRCRPRPFHGRAPWHSAEPPRQGRHRYGRPRHRACAWGPAPCRADPRISSRESYTSAQSTHSSRCRRTSAVREGGSSPSERSEISATSGCPAVSVVDVTLAHLRPSQQLNRLVLHHEDLHRAVPLPVGRCPLRPVPSAARLVAARRFRCLHGDG